MAAAKRGDFAVALQEWQLLNKQGDAIAWDNLRVMYARGERVVVNFVTAHLWGNISRADGHDSDTFLNPFKKQMVKDQIAHVQQRDSACVTRQFTGC